MPALRATRVPPGSARISALRLGPLLCTAPSVVVMLLWMVVPLVMTAVVLAAALQPHG